MIKVKSFIIRLNLENNNNCLFLRDYVKRRPR